MARRPAISILVITQQKLIRADFGRSAAGGPSVVYEAERPTIDDHAGLVETTIRLGGPVGKNVWLLSAEAFAQTLDVPTGTVSGVSDEELERALSFEAEALSNINAFDSAIGHVSLGMHDGQHRFFVCQAPASELSQIDELLRRADARFVGVTHPAGAPAPLAGGSPSSWHRVELWPDAIVCVGAAADGEVARLMLHADPRTSGWRDEVEQWRAAFGAGAERELLITDDLDVPEDSGQRVRALTDPATRDAWLTAWASALERGAGGARGAPIVRAPKRTMTSSGRFALAAVFTLLAIGACYGHHLWLTSQLEDARREHERVLGPVKQLNEKRQQADKLEQSLQQQRETIATLGADVVRLDEALALERRRLGDLLRAVAIERPDNLWINSIRIGDVSGGLVIHGVSLEQGLPELLADRLSSALRSRGWLVDPPEKEAQGVTQSGGPWMFSLPVQCREMRRAALGDGSADAALVARTEGEG